MAERNNQKVKILYLMKVLLERTDETHSLTMPQIIDALKAYDVTAERKSIYNDIEQLRNFGIDIIGEKVNRNYYYHVGSREFELPELKLLVDSVQSAKFITAKKSNELIKKIEGLASKYEAAQLQRQVYVSQRIKTVNENIYYNVDQVHMAIAGNVQISFQYFNWNVQKEQVLRRSGERYKVSPWALSWDDENYYMIAYDSAEEKIKHFRVDKMLHIELEQEAREGSASFERFDIGLYAKKVFGMFAGEEERVQIECENYLAGVFIDRFGKEVSMRPVDQEHFRVSVYAAVSNQFISWVLALGAGARIVGPDRVVERVRDEVRRMADQYLTEE